MIIKTDKEFINNYGIGTEDGCLMTILTQLLLFVLQMIWVMRNYVDIFGVSNMGVRAYTEYLLGQPILILLSVVM